MKTETKEKMARVTQRIADGQPVKTAIKAEHIAQATWYKYRKTALQASKEWTNDGRSVGSVAPVTEPRSKRQCESPVNGTTGRLNAIEALFERMGEELAEYKAQLAKTKALLKELL
jgi:hypothetical protein